MSGHEQVRDAVKAELGHLGEEVEVVYAHLVLPGWGGPLHGLHRTLYGYVMNCFAFIEGSVSPADVCEPMSAGIP